MDCPSPLHTSILEMEYGEPPCSHFESRTLKGLSLTPNFYWVAASTNHILKVKTELFMSIGFQGDRTFFKRALICSACIRELPTANTTGSPWLPCIWRSNKFFLGPNCKTGFALRNIVLRFSDILSRQDPPNCFLWRLRSQVYYWEKAGGRFSFPIPKFIL